MYRAWRAGYLTRITSECSEVPVVLLEMKDKYKYASMYYCPAGYADNARIYFHTEWSNYSYLRAMFLSISKWERSLTQLAHLSVYFGARTSFSGIQSFIFFIRSLKDRVLGRIQIKPIKKLNWKQLYTISSQLNGYLYPNYVEWIWFWPVQWRRTHLESNKGILEGSTFY